jgi:hypothetical protein
MLFFTPSAPSLFLFPSFSFPRSATAYDADAAPAHSARAGPGRKKKEKKKKKKGMVTASFEGNAEFLQRRFARAACKPTFAALRITEIGREREEREKDRERERERERERLIHLSDVLRPRRFRETGRNRPLVTTNR